MLEYWNKPILVPRGLMKRISKIALAFLLFWGCFLGAESWIIRKYRRKNSNGNTSFVPDRAYSLDEDFGLGEDFGLIPVLAEEDGLYG